MPWYLVFTRSALQQCENADVAELVIVTEAVKESQMLDSLEHLKDMETIREVSSVIREY